MNVSHQKCTFRPVLLSAVFACAVPVSLLAGCGPQDPNSFAPACAPVGILAEAADYSDYGPGGSARPDLSRLVSHGSITAVSGHCSSGANGTELHTVIQLQMAVDRGPVQHGSSVSVPYFIAVTLNGAVVSKQSLTALAQFPDNGDKVLVKTDPVVLDLPLTRSRPGTSYRIEVGFQLSPEQLDYNRAHLPR
jgi:hypothetical protein